MHAEIEQGMPATIQSRTLCLSIC